LAKLKIWSRRPNFAPETYRHSLGCNFYHFTSVRSKNVSVEFWRLFRSGHHWSRKSWKQAPDDSVYLPKHTHTFFGVQILSFPMSTAKLRFGTILTTFPGPGTTGAGPERAKLITGPGWPSFAPKTYPQCLGYSSNRLSSVLLKTVLVEFRRLFQARAPPEQVKWKARPKWFSFALETYPPSSWCSLYRFQSVQLKNVLAEFWGLFHDTTVVGQVENLVRKTQFCTRNIPTLFEVQFLSFLVSTVEKCFDRVLTTFRVRAPLEQEKLKTGPRLLDLVPETYLHFFGVQFLLFPMSTAKQCFGPILTTFSGTGTTEAWPEKAKSITGPGWPGFALETYPHCLG